MNFITTKTKDFTPFTIHITIESQNDLLVLECVQRNLQQNAHRFCQDFGHMLQTAKTQGINL